MKKNLIAIIISLLLLTVMTGCSGNSSEEGSGSSSENTNSTEDSNISSSSPEDSKESEAYNLAQTVLEAVEFPEDSMSENMTPEDAMLSFSVDTELCEDYYFSVNLMRTQLNEILIAKPKEGCKEQLKEQFDAHVEYLKEQAALYEEQEVSVSGTVTGELDNGYCYIIVHENGSEAEEALEAI